MIQHSPGTSRTCRNINQPERESSTARTSLFRGLVVAQDGTPQRKRVDPSYIEGLDVGQLFNDLTGDVYEDPDIVFVAYLGKRAIEFAPDGGGVVLDHDVPLDDSRCAFSTTDDGKRCKPKATTFADYLVFLPESEELLVWSAKSTSLREARRVNSFLRRALRIGDVLIASPPAWARTFKARVVDVPGTNPYYAIRFAPGGVTPEALRKSCADFYQANKNLEIQVAKSDAPVDDAPAPAGAITQDDIPY